MHVPAWIEGKTAGEAIYYRMRNKINVYNKYYVIEVERVRILIKNDLLGKDIYTIFIKIMKIYYLEERKKINFLKIYAYVRMFVVFYSYMYMYKENDWISFLLIKIKMSIAFVYK